ncbi:MAG: hypothetical protein FP829_02725 [Nitrospirae bacterium]|nr:hypothetical protein [Nitrospirota bacterium]
MANADNLRRLAEEMASAYEERVQRISAIKQETADSLHAFAAEGRQRKDYMVKSLAEFDNVHSEMAKELKDKLTREEEERKTATQAEIKERKGSVSSMLAEFNKEDKGRAAEIERLLEDFDKAHAEMAKELKDKLTREEEERKTATQAEIKERKGSVSNMLDEFKKEQAEAAAAWKELLAGMQSVRGKVTITGPSEVEAAVKVTPVKKAKPVKKAIEEIEEEVAPEEVEEGLKDRVLGVLGNNPGGLRMAEVADKLGIESWQPLIPIMKELRDEGKIRKEDSIYYAA